MKVLLVLQICWAGMVWGGSLGGCGWEEGNLETGTAVSASGCAQQCAKQPKCSRFMFYPKQSRCDQYTGEAVLQESLEVSAGYCAHGSSSGPGSRPLPAGSKDGCAWEAGNMLLTTAASTTDCVQQCIKEPLCARWMYFKKDAECYRYTGETIVEESFPANAGHCPTIRFTARA